VRASFCSTYASSLALLAEPNTANRAEPCFSLTFRNPAAARSSASSHVASRNSVKTSAPVRCSSGFFGRSEEHTSELQSREKLVCRHLLEQKQGSEGRERA